MTEQQEKHIRRSYVGGLLAIKWLKESRGWSFKDSKEYVDSYPSLMTYDHIFEHRKIPDEVLREVFPFNLDSSIQLEEE